MMKECSQEEKTRQITGEDGEVPYDVPLSSKIRILFSNIFQDLLFTNS